jgi:hypothetical protein
VASGLQASRPLCIRAAVNGEACAGDVAGLWARDEGDQRSDVLDVAVALKRCGRELRLGVKLVPCRASCMMEFDGDASDRNA